jgi:hypothetical protein
MNNYNVLKDDLLQISYDISSLFRNVRSIPGLSNFSFEEWENTCENISEEINKEIVRVAVVGPIKSGKSTFVNSLFKGDYLKRGAGVVTSIVTRIRCGPSLKATLYFKFWEEVNEDIEQALVLFPTLDWRSENDRFELRRHRQRLALQEALNTLGTEQLITNDTRNVNSVLLSSYLKGYEKVQNIISSDSLTRTYGGDRFPEHMLFVGNDSLSVYLKDIQLDINCNEIDGNIEIADCQGSDSPNPLHLAKIQDYLLLTHLIVYVISSRTGLRQADIKFLSIIKKMGIMENILFVINCDFNEHTSIEDLSALIEKVKEELALIKTNPRVYTLSALYNLFEAQSENLSQKDKNRYVEWKKEKLLVDFSDRETEGFEVAFKNKITGERYALLLRNHLERLGIVAEGVDRWIHMNQNLLSKDAESAIEMIETMKGRQDRMNQIKSIVRTTLDGAIQKIKQDIRVDVDRFFDKRSGKVLGDVIHFVRNYQVAFEEYEETLTSGFANTLFLVFQELKQSVDTFMAEVANPEIIRFIREQEKHIKDYLESVGRPYDSMVQEAIADYNRTIENLDIFPEQERHDNAVSTDIESIKNVMGLKLPPGDATMRYSTRIKTEAIAHLGFYTVLKIFKKLLKKQAQNEKEGEIQALKDGLKRMKRETERSIIDHFKNYKENVKFQYIFKLADAASNKLYEGLIERFQSYVTDLSKTVDLISDKQSDKQQAYEILKEMELASNDVGIRIKKAREKIELIAQNPNTSKDESNGFVAQVPLSDRL